MIVKNLVVIGVLLLTTTVMLLLLLQCGGGAVPRQEVITIQATPIQTQATLLPDQPGLESGEIQRVVDFTHKNVCYIHRATGHIDCLPLRQE